MALTQLAPPYPIFTDKNGDPLDAGYLYFGELNLNPETNPIQVYWDNMLTQPAAQPIRTTNGYPARNGAPALIYADDRFSVTVRNKRNELVTYSPTGFGVIPFAPVTFATSDFAVKDVATLLADVNYTYAAGVPNTIQVSPGDILRTLSEGFAYEVAASGATDEHVTTAGGVKLYVLPIEGVLNTSAFDGAGIGAKFNAAVAAAKYWTQNTTTTWYPDIPSIRIDPGTYALDTTLVIDNVSNLNVDASGVQITNFASAIPAIKLVVATRATVEGLFLNYRGNDVADEAVLIAGQSSWSTLIDVKVQANSANSNFAAFRCKQGDLSGFDDNDRNKGNFWITLDRCWTRKLTGGDPNNIAIAVDLQGAQNAFRIINCSFNNVGDAVVIRNQNGSLLSGISNDVQLTLTAIETFTRGVVYTATGGATPFVAGGAAVGCRFESGTSAFVSELTGTPSIPFCIVGATRISSVTNMLVDARGSLDSFNLIGGAFTPGHAQVLGGNGGTRFFNPDTSFPVLSVIPKQAANGGSIALRRIDGTTDGLFVQRAGGGMDISSPTGRMRLVNLQGLSGSGTHAVNFRGVVTLPAAATSVAVTLPNTEPDASYQIIVPGVYNANFWVTGKTTTGFTINASVAPAGNTQVPWLLYR